MQFKSVEDVEIELTLAEATVGFDEKGWLFTVWPGAEKRNNIDRKKNNTIKTVRCVLLLLGKV